MCICGVLCDMREAGAANLNQLNGGECASVCNESQKIQQKREWAMLLKP